MELKTIKRKILSLFIVMSVFCSLLGGFTVHAAATDPPDSLRDGLQVWYKFDETDGTVAKDSSGKGRDGAVMGGADWITTKDDKGVALNLDNTAVSGKYVDVPTSVMQDVPDDFTISTWIKVKDCPVWGRILDYGSVNSNVMLWTANSYYFKMDNNDAKGIDPPRNGTVAAFKQGCPASFLWPEGYSSPRWQHVTITRKDNTTTLWINGIKWASKSYETVNPRTGDDYKFYIGKSLWSADPYPSMDIRDFRIYNRSLSINEINGVMSEGEWADEIQVHYAMDSVALGDLTGVTQNLYLPTTVNDRVSVTWTSDDPALEANANIGVVNRPAAGKSSVTAKLTGTFTYGGYSESMDYDVTILPKSADDVTYQMTVDTKNPLHSMSPTMYGLFFEDLSMAGDGGLYGELLRNTCFHDDNASIPYWHLYTSEGAKGNMSLNKTNNLNSAQFQHLKLDINTLPEKGYVGIRNEGYNGMKFEKGKEYQLTFFARSEGFSGSVSAVLLSATGEKISVPVKADSITSDWKEYELTLTPEEYAAQGELAMYCEGSKGTVYFDVVSLFPETYKDHGLRKDMVEYLEDLNPTFLRFPGGCYVEGKTMADAFRWKNTLYNKEDRAGHNSLWNYRVTDGLGYYEFLELSEDLGVEPMYVCGVGIAHEDNEDWQYWIQDVLEAIEFANGDITTKWGKVRAEMGHPKPFNMKYIEIGNEAHFQYDLYQARYQDFYDAIKEKYPYMNLIADCDIPDNTIDMVDEHHYSDPQFFINNAYKYDGYDRDGYEVYVGEYAVNGYHGLQNLHAAIGEAAFMTGMERNSDIVTMTSYSELFVNLNHQNWNATAAFIDSSRIYGSPSYYAQKMFGEQMGDVVLSTGLEASDGKFKTDIAGGVGLGTWNTNASYSDIKVTSNDDNSILFDGNSADDSAWTKGTGQWSVSDGTVNQTAITADCRTWIDGKDWTNYTYEVTARKNSGAEGFLMIVGEQDSDNFYYINLGGWNNTQSAVQKTSKGTKSEVTAFVPGNFEAGRDYKLKAVVNKNNIKVYVDGEVMFDYTNHGSTDCPLYYVSQRDNETGNIIIKVVNTSDSDYNTDIKLDGAKGVASKATAAIMTSQSKYDENSFENPENVAPVTIPVSNVSDDFNYTFMRNSITVLVIPTQYTGVDKTKLQKAVDAEKEAALREADYTADTWRVYKTALTKAEGLLDETETTQEAIDAAVKALADAKALLKKAEEEKPPVPEVLADFNFDKDGGSFDGGYAVAAGTCDLADHGTGKALKLDGNGQFLDVTTKDGKSVLSGVKEFTVSYQAKPEKGAGNWGIFAARNAAEQKYEQEHYIGVLDQNGTVRAERYNGGKRPEVPSKVVENDGWYHVTAVFSENESVLYINGEEVSRKDSAFTVEDILGNNSILYIGKANWKTGEFYKGLIDNFKIVSRSMTAKEIAAEAAKYTDKSALQAAVDAAIDPDEKENYTKDSWDAYEKVLTKAETVLGDKEAAQSEIDEAADNLTKALKDLVKAVTTIDVTTLPTKTEYITGEELDLAGMVISGKYADGTTVDITKDCKVEGYDPLETGKQTLTVTYQDKKTTFTIMVKEEEPSDPVYEIFSDISKDDWYVKNVQYVFDKNIMKGMTETEFGSNVVLTRSHFATMLYRMEGEPEVDYTERFQDVPEGEFYTNPVIWASSDGVNVISGYEDGKFGPNDSITREQMAVMLYRYAQYKKYDVTDTNDLKEFNDSDKVSEFAEKAMKWAVGVELIKGEGDGKQLNPQGVTSRAVCATIMQRFLTSYDK